MKKIILTTAVLALLFSCGNQHVSKSDRYILDQKEAPLSFGILDSSPDMEMAYDYTTFQESNTEEYAKVTENDFKEVLKNPLSTFSVDVDGASYSNARRFLTQGYLPAEGAVRIEEFINYFTYNYPQPTGEDPFSIYTEMGECPWNPENKLVHIGLQGKNVPKEDMGNSNLVFLLDVSGSMDAPYKLPLLKSSFGMLVDQLGEKDRIAIVVYAGAAGVVLPSTSCTDKATILKALDKLEAGGSTAGGEGIELAYKIAQENFIKEGNNRIILATDGDFNVGPSSSAALVKMIEEKRESGVFLSVLGFGMGNYKDSKMEELADYGNGNYYYIDDLFEAKKVLVSEMGSTLLTIAKDVKIQIEFNPAKVAKYRLVGYENRVMQNEDFANDKKDAGEIGASHTVTALYEIVPVGKDVVHTQTEYKYQTTGITENAYKRNELATVKFRYKKPDGDTSILLEQVITEKNQTLKETSNDYRFSAAVAEFAMLLRDSEYKGTTTYAHILELANNAKGADVEGCRAQFIDLVTMAKSIDRKQNE